MIVDEETNTLSKHVFPFYLEMLSIFYQCDIIFNTTEMTMVKQIGYWPVSSTFMYVIVHPINH